MAGSVSVVGGGSRVQARAVFALEVCSATHDLRVGSLESEVVDSLFDKIGVKRSDVRALIFLVVRTAHILHHQVIVLSHEVGMRALQMMLALKALISRSYWQKVVLDNLRANCFLLNILQSLTEE